MGISQLPSSAGAGKSSHLPTSIGAGKSQLLASAGAGEIRNDMNDLKLYSNLDSRICAGLEWANFAEVANTSSLKYRIPVPNPTLSMTQKRHQNAELPMSNPSDPMQAFMQMI